MWVSLYLYKWGKGTFNSPLPILQDTSPKSVQRECENDQSTQALTSNVLIYQSLVKTGNRFFLLFNAETFLSSAPLTH